MKVLVTNNLTGLTEEVEIEEVEGVIAPDPTTPQLSTDEKLTQMAEQLVITQTNLSEAQEALDFLLMEGF